MKNEIDNILNEKLFLHKSALNLILYYIFITCNMYANMN